MIKTIIFDWGGVLTVGRFTFSLIDLIKKRLDLNVDIFQFIDSLLKIMDTGEMDIKGFAEKVNNEFNANISPYSIYCSSVI